MENEQKRYEDHIAGRNAVTEALKSGRPLDSVLVARGDRQGSIGPIIAKCRQMNIPVKEVDSRKLDAMAQNHQGVIAVAACMLIIFFPYAFARVDTWLHIEEADPLGSAWQTIQGLMAIGSGGLFGKGLGNSQQKYGFVSQPQNDFIFTIVCEEFGFIGAILVIGLFVAFVWRGFYIARHAPDKCSSLIVYGLTFKVALQVILNIAVVTNTIPNTGQPLPFVSYGGTSLVFLMGMAGLLLNISRYPKE